MQAEAKNEIQQNILIVDDNEDNRKLAEKFIRLMGHKTILAENGMSALAKIKINLPDLILLDIQMPEMNGLEVLERLKTDTQFKNIPVLVISGDDDMNQIIQCIEYGAVDYLIKPFNAKLLQARIKTVLAEKKLKDQVAHYQEKLELYNVSLEETVRQRTQALHDTHLDVVYRLGRAAEYRDNENGLHVIRMSLSCERLAKGLGVSDKECEQIRCASPLHDIGKIGVPDDILLKPGKLNEKEWEVMQTHAEIGAGILAGSDSDLLKMAEMIALTHHEKWDGSGYPVGLKGEEIPLIGRIVPVCDVFDALTSDRPYKKKWTTDEAVAHLKKESGSHFDPNILETFLSVLPDIMKIQEKYQEVSPKTTSFNYQT